MKIQRLYCSWAADGTPTDEYPVDESKKPIFIDCFDCKQVKDAIIAFRDDEPVGSPQAYRALLCLACFHKRWVSK